MLGSSSDFIKELKKDTQLCKLNYKGKQVTPENYDALLSESVKSFVEKMAASSKTELKAYVNAGINKAYVWYNGLFWIYVVLSIVYLIYTFSLTLDIEANDGKTAQIPDWAKIFYIIFGISLLWIGLLVFFLLWWLVSPRICDASSVYALYALIIFIIIYILITQIALVGPLIKDELFADDDSFKYNLTTAGTWVLFGIIVIIIAFYIYKAVSKKKPSEMVSDEKLKKNNTQSTPQSIIKTQEFPM